MMNVRAVTFVDNTPPGLPVKASQRIVNTPGGQELINSMKDQPTGRTAIFHGEDYHGQVLVEKVNFDPPIYDIYKNAQVRSGRGDAFTSVGRSPQDLTPTGTATADNFLGRIEFPNIEHVVQEGIQIFKQATKKLPNSMDNTVTPEQAFKNLRNVFKP
jgi:hypothetical protein